MNKFSQVICATFGLSLPLLATTANAEPAKATAADIMEFCTALLPADASKKAEALGWHRIEGEDLDDYRAFFDPLSDRPHDVQVWRRDLTDTSDKLAYAYYLRPDDGTFVSELRSLLPNPHSCTYQGSGDADALKNAVTGHFGSATGRDGERTEWKTSSVYASVWRFTQPDSSQVLLLNLMYH